MSSPYRYDGQKITAQHGDGEFHHLLLKDGRRVKTKASEWQALWDTENAKPMYRQRSAWTAAALLGLGFVAVVLYFVVTGGGDGCLDGIDPC